MIYFESEDLDLDLFVDAREDKRDFDFDLFPSAIASEDDEAGLPRST